MSFFVIVTGPSAVGKTTVVNALLAQMPPATRLITMTSRAPRPHETDGRDYYFVSAAEFRARIANGDFLEWAESYGHYYGSSRSKLAELLARHQIVVGVLDFQGARTVMGLMPECRVIALAPGAIADLRRRLVSRDGVLTPEARRRLARVKEELAAAAQFHYQVTNFDGRLDETVAAVKQYLEGLLFAQVQG